MNTRRKCTASAYQRTVVYKRATIYKGLVPYLVTTALSDYVETT